MIYYSPLTINYCDTTSSTSTITWTWNSIPDNTTGSYQYQVGVQVSYDDAWLGYIKWGLFSKIPLNEHVWNVKLLYDGYSSRVLEISCSKCKAKILYSFYTYPLVEELRTQLARVCKCFRDVFVFDEI